MVVVHKSANRQQGNKKMETRVVARSQQDTNITKNIPGDHQAFAYVAFDERGNVRIHASDQVKGYLDEMLLSAQFKRAYEQSRNEAACSARQATLTGEVDDIAPDEPRDYTSVTPAKPMAQSRGRRGFQPAMQRGRPTIPHPTQMPMCQTTSREAPIEPVVTSPVELHFPLQKQMKFLRIDDSEAVVSFLVNRLKRMQQLADKKIAKAWIKGICPKKQAKFPYQNNKQEKETGIKPEVPAWWPDVDTVCRFIEPDHIRREERMKLCLHLLRLRPTPAQLEQWNRFDTAPSKTHQQRGWTAWLKELAGPEIFEDLPREPCHRTKYRCELMAQMYDVAEMEEEYLKEGIDEGEQFIYEEEEEERKHHPTKRSRRPSTASTPDCDATSTRSASSSCSRAPAKRRRRDSVSATAQKLERRGSKRKPDLEMLDGQSAAPIVLGQDISASSFEGGFETFPGHNIPQPPHPVQFQGHTHSLPQQGKRRGFDHVAEWHDRNISSYGEYQASSHMPCPAQPAPNTFPGSQDFEFPQYHPFQQPLLNHMGQVSQPEYQTVPNTLVYSSAGMVSLPMESWPMQQVSMPHLPAEQRYAMTMAPIQYFTPAHSDHTVTEFHSPTNMASNQYQQQPDVQVERHIAPMQALQSQGMPLQQPLPWNHHYHQDRHQ